MKKASLSWSILTEDALYLQISSSASKKPHDDKNFLNGPFSPSYSEQDIVHFVH